MSRKLNFSIGEFYHIYNRGIDKRVIFNTLQDNERFVILLYLANSIDNIKLSNLDRTFELGKAFFLERSETLVDIGAYCLMPNHFHILVKEKVENGISRFMHKISTAYTMYFNKKNNRTGSLFQGTFKSEHAENDMYLKYLFSYICLNPVKLIEPNWKEKGVTDLEKVKKFLTTYDHSSYIDHLKNERVQGKILSTSAFPNYFSMVGDFDKMLDFWLKYKKLQD